MRKGLKGQALGMLRRAMMVLLALGLLSALAPAAMAFEGGYPAGAADCCSPTSTSCDGPSVACTVQVCQQTSPLAREDAQTPTFTAVIGEPGWRERILPPPESVAASPAVLALGGPPAYLRFHRFLL
jgi:hypothetical protein